MATWWVISLCQKPSWWRHLAPSSISSNSGGVQVVLVFFLESNPNKERKALSSSFFEALASFPRRFSWNARFSSLSKHANNFVEPILFHQLETYIFQISPVAALWLSLWSCSWPLITNARFRASQMLSLEVAWQFNGLFLHRYWCLWA